MHECLLFASIPPTQHEHILRILAGISAMQPLPVHDCHLLFKPIKTSLLTRVSPTATSTTTKSTNAFTGPGSSSSLSSSSAGTAASQQLSNDLFYLQLVGDLTQSRSHNNSSTTTDILSELSGAIQDGIGTENESQMAIDSVVEQQHQQQHQQHQQQTATQKSPDETTLWTSYPWTLTYAAVPDVPGKRPATSRLISSIPLLDGNPREFMAGLGYTFVTGYLVHGHRFTHNHLRITLCRTFPLAGNHTNQNTTTSTSTQNSSSSSSSSNNAELSSLLTLLNSNGDDGFDALLRELQPLDTSGGYLLQVSARVSDGSKPELMDKAFAELAGFRDLLRGVVALQPVERLALDTRVRGGEKGVQTVATPAVAAQAQVRSAAVVR